MKLVKDTWHGYTRLAGEEVTPDPYLDETIVKDSHGCESKWFRDSKGQLINLWECEVGK